MKSLRLWLAVLVLALAAGIGGWLHFWRREHRFDGLIQAAAGRYGVDPALVKAVVWRESSFDPHARGRAGEIGLMQLGEIAAQEWADAERLTNFTHEHALDARTNTLAGARYLGKLLKRYAHTDNPTVYALADYNAGRTHVLRWNKGAAATNSAAFLAQMDYPGTQHYVRSILERRGQYHREFRAVGAVR
ncbi:MAG: lytic transglycosylase domain-containing protein [Verrucomicrobia bacterium]|nr:lytic transglycosylase domain-containing protein [Verrucomicrobiota bacterium]